MSFLYKLNLDFAGVTASVICAIHCMAVPVILSLGIVNSSHWIHNHGIDMAVIATGIIIAALSLVSDYKKHKSLIPLITIIIGFGLLCYGLLEKNHDTHLWWSLAGSLCVISAHLINWSKSKMYSLCKTK